jgi:hypothetical protein
LLARLLAQSIFNDKESFSKISNRGIILLSFLPSFFALLKLDSKIIGALIGFGEILWCNTATKLQKAMKKELSDMKEKRGVPFKLFA